MAYHPSNQPKHFWQFFFHWNPTADLVVVGLSWLLVTGALYTATVILGPDFGGGIPYFLLYGVLAAGVLGVGLPAAWMTVVRKRSLASLGITTRLLGASLVLQIIFAAGQYFLGMRGTALPPFEQFVPLLALALSIGFFEAIFWRGWVLLRLEEAFGFLPAILLGSAFYAAYHVGYAMPLEEIGFLFFIGLFYGISFRLTKNIFILWPVLQPMGQMMTLVRDGLELPMMAAVGFVELLVAMFVLLWFLQRRWHKREAQEAGKQGSKEIQTALSG